MALLNFALLIVLAHFSCSQISIRLRQRQLDSNSITTPENVNQKASATSTSSTPGLKITNVNLIEYYGTVTLGSTTQNVVFDTSINYMWISQSTCIISETTKSCPGKNKYTPSTQGTESMSYYFVEDNLFSKISGYYLSNSLTVDGKSVASQDFLGITSAGSYFTSWTADGVIGLSPKANDVHASFLTNIKSSLPYNMFAMYISKDSNTDSSQITFGGINVNFLGDYPFHWESMAEKTSWSVKVNKIHFGSATYSNPSIFVLNSAEPYLRMTQSDFKVIERYMRGNLDCTYNSHFQYYCYLRYNSYSDFPDLKLEMDSMTFEIPAENFVVLEDDSISKSRIGRFLISISSSYTFNTIGLVGLREYYTIYCKENSTIGFIIPKTDYESGILIIVLPILITIVIVGSCVVFFCYKKKKYGYWCDNPYDRSGNTDLRPTQASIPIAGSSPNASPNVSRNIAAI